MGISRENVNLNEHQNLQKIIKEYKVDPLVERKRRSSVVDNAEKKINNKII